MQRFANWTNLSETTFVLPPTSAGGRLPGAHLHAGGRAAVRRAPHARHLPRLARGARRGARDRRAGVRRRARARAPDGPPASRSPRRRWSARGRCEEPLVERDRRRPAGSSAPRSSTPQWVDNGPGWVAVLLASAEAVLAVRAALHRARPRGGRPATRRARRRRSRCARSSPRPASLVEDPVTGSLNASLAGWLLRTGPPHGALRRPPGHRARPRAAASTSSATTTARSGSAAGR